MRKISLIVVLISITGIAYSQGFGVGLKGGLNFPTFDALGVQDGINVSDTKNSSGYHIGAFARIRVAKIGIQPEVLYSFQQIEFDQIDVTQTFNVEQKLSYLTVPVMLKWFMIAGINLQVGPQFGFALSGKRTDDILGATTTTDFKDEINSTDISLALGAGIDLPFGLDIHGRYVLGLTDVNDQAGVSTEKNSQIQISIGYQLVGLGR